MCAGGAWLAGAGARQHGDDRRAAAPRVALSLLQPSAHASACAARREERERFLERGCLDFYLRSRPVYVREPGARLLLRECRTEQFASSFFASFAAAFLSTSTSSLQPWPLSLSAPPARPPSPAPPAPPLGPRSSRRCVCEREGARGEGEERQSFIGSGRAGERRRRPVHTPRGTSPVREAEQAAEPASLRPALGGCEASPRPRAPRVRDKAGGSEKHSLLARLSPLTPPRAPTFSHLPGLPAQAGRRRRDWRRHPGGRPPGVRPGEFFVEGRKRKTRASGGGDFGRSLFWRARAGR